MNYNINYNYLRPKKADRLKEWYSRPFECRDDLEAYTYSDATILPLKQFENDSVQFGRGGVVTENGEYVDKSSIEARVYGSYEVENCCEKDEKVVYCGYLINHWGHFLVEAICRLWYFLENDDSVDKYVFFLQENEERQIKGNYKEFFELLGVFDKLEIINKPTKYREVIVPELSYKARTYYSEEFKRIFETVAANVTAAEDWEKYEKIFLTRSQLKKAQKYEFGMEAVDSFFRNNGYKIISPEKISLSELIFLIRNASDCASVSGSLPHNMLFANDMQKLTIVEREVLNNDFQVDFNRVKNFSVTYIDAHIALYPVNFSGPFIMFCEGELKKYAQAHKMQPPDKKYCTEKYINKCFKKYIKKYLNEYGYQWYMMDWYIQYNHIGYIYEAYQDGAEYFADYINRRKPIFIYQFFSLSSVKRFIKSVLKGNRRGK